MNSLEILRFDWKPNELRVLLVALCAPGPAPKAAWLARTQIPRGDKLLEAIDSLREARAVVPQFQPDGIVVQVQPATFWRVRETATREDWLQAWGPASEQMRLGLVTETPGMSDVLAVNCPDSGRPESGQLPEIRAMAAPSNSRDRVLVEKIGSDRRDRGDRIGGPRHFMGDGSSEREWLMTKLKRIPQLHREVTRPEGELQERMCRMFWEAEMQDSAWLRETVGFLADSTGVKQPAAWMNRALSSRLRTEVKA